MFILVTLLPKPSTTDCWIDHVVVIALQQPRTTLLSVMNIVDEYCFVEARLTRIAILVLEHDNYGLYLCGDVRVRPCFTLPEKKPYPVSTMARCLYQEFSLGGRNGVSVESWRGKLSVNSPWISLLVERNVVIYGVCAELVVPDFGQRLLLVFGLLAWLHCPGICPGAAGKQEITRLM